MAVDTGLVGKVGSLDMEADMVVALGMHRRELHILVAHIAVLVERAARKAVEIQAAADREHMDLPRQVEG